jgi:hypothetical protein
MALACDPCGAYGVGGGGTASFVSLCVLITAQLKFIILEGKSARNSPTQVYSPLHISTDLFCSQNDSLNISLEVILLFHYFRYKPTMM